MSGPSEFLTPDERRAPVSAAGAILPPVDADEVRRLVLQDATDNPHGHPCRRCDVLHKDHPTATCEQWS